ncbi:inner centromere protein A-like [Discoglossus pictus]
MNNIECVSNLLQVCTHKTAEFLLDLENKYMVWLVEIEEEARKMFSTQTFDFNAEPELMPKTPSQKRRRKKRSSLGPDENWDPNSRSSRRRSSTNWSTSVRRLSVRIQNKQVKESVQEVPEKPKRLTRACANSMTPPVPEIPLPEPPSEVCQSRVLQVKISARGRRSAERQNTNKITVSTREPSVPETDIPPAPVTPESKSQCVTKLNLADASTPKQSVEETLAADQGQLTEELKIDRSLDLKDPKVTQTGSLPSRRSGRRSIAGRQSASQRASLFAQYSLASKRENMTQEAVRKSIRRSISKKRATENSLSSSRSYQSSIEDEDTIKVRPETVAADEAPAPQPSRPSLRSRDCKTIEINNQRELPEKETRQTIASATECFVVPGDDAQIRRKSYKRAVDELSDDDHKDEVEHSPPCKKTPSPTCRPSKVVRPPPQVRSFLHTVQKNQLLITPGSLGRTMVKSLMKRNTPLKTDPKEKERQRQEALRKKEEAELQRKQKIEEVKKRKQEELKMRREERLKKVLQARERVEQLEEEKKKKMEQKFAHNDEKSEKVREDRVAEEKAKKKMTVKKQEELESRRRQEEDARRLKAKQMEEEERKHQELLQRKREEEELERQRKMAEAKERERLREQQLAAEKEQERLRVEKECAEKEKALQLLRKMELHQSETEERKKRELQEHLEQESLERMRTEQKVKNLLEELESKRLQEEQERKAKELIAAANCPVLNLTVDILKSPAVESYQMTPQGYKQPKIEPENYGMDLNSDDSTDDESQPRKPIPAWASGNLLAQAVQQHYYNPINVGHIFGIIDAPKLEELFNKNKPRYFKRTSSAVWHSPPLSSNRQDLAAVYRFKK